MAAGLAVQKQQETLDTEVKEQGKELSLPLRYTNSIIDDSDDSIELQEVTIVSLVEELPKDLPGRNHASIQFRLKDKLSRKSIRFWNRCKRYGKNTVTPQARSSAKADSVEVIVRHSFDDSAELKCPARPLDKKGTISNRRATGPRKYARREEATFPSFDNCRSIPQLLSNLNRTVDWFFDGYPHNMRKRRKKLSVDRATINSCMLETLTDSMDERSFRSERQGTLLDEETITLEKDEKNRWDDDYSSFDSIPETVQLIFGNTVDEVTTRLLDSALFDTQEWLLVEGQLSRFAEYLLSEAGANFESFVASLNGPVAPKKSSINDVVSDSDSSCTASLLNNIEGKIGKNTKHQCSSQQGRFKNFKKLKHLFLLSTYTKNEGQDIKGKKQVPVDSTPGIDARQLLINKIQLEHLRRLKKLKQQIHSSMATPSPENDIHAKANIKIPVPSTQESTDAMHRLRNNIQQEHLQKLRELKKNIAAKSAGSHVKNKKARKLVKGKTESSKAFDWFLATMSKQMMTMCVKPDSNMKNDVSFYCSKPIRIQEFINEREQALPQVSLSTQSTAKTLESLSSKSDERDEKLDSVRILAGPKFLPRQTDENIDFAFAIPLYPSEEGSAASAEKPKDITIIDLYGVLSACSDRAGNVEAAMKQLLSCELADRVAFTVMSHKDVIDLRSCKVSVPSSCASVDNKDPEQTVTTRTMKDCRLKIATVSESFDAPEKLKITVGSHASASLKEAVDAVAIEPEMIAPSTREEEVYLAKFRLIPIIHESLEEVEVYDGKCSSNVATHASDSRPVSVPNYIPTSPSQHDNATVKTMASEQEADELRDSKEVDVWLHEVHCLRKRQ